MFVRLMSGFYFMIIINLIFFKIAVALTKDLGNKPGAICYVFLILFDIAERVINDLFWLVFADAVRCN